jgi:hypothetical protein
MPGRVFFEIADIPWIKARLVEAIPADWKWFGPGQLVAPTAMIDAGIAVRGSGYVIGVQSWSRAPTLGDPYPLLIERKAPGFLDFEESQADSVLTRIAAGFLHQGYSGRLSFRKDCHRNYCRDNPARCDMRFGTWRGFPFQSDEDGSQPPRIKLEWDESYRGSEADIAPIVAVCRTLGLREYTPAPRGHDVHGTLLDFGRNLRERPISREEYPTTPHSSPPDLRSR